MLSGFTIVEHFISAKSGNADNCEDGISIGENYVAVIDGATSKTDRKWNGETSGRMAARILADAIKKLPPSSTAVDAVKFLTAAIDETYNLHGVKKIVEDDPKQRISASAAIFNSERREIWMVGDCQALIGDRLICEHKAIDKLLSTIRSIFLEIEIARGERIENLLKDDIGRKLILPLLERQTFLQNNPDGGDFWYPVLDGFTVPEKGIKALPIPPDVDTIILATDGYPILRNNLEDSEAELQRLLLSDPLLFRQYKSTKGVRSGNESFDDRAYIKLKINRLEK